MSPFLKLSELKTRLDPPGTFLPCLTVSGKDPVGLWVELRGKEAGELLGDGDNGGVLNCFVGESVRLADITSSWLFVRAPSSSV